MTAPILKDVFNIDAEVVQDPRTGKPVCITYDLVEEKQVVTASA
jgi:iron complex transport system ATP-binding protein